MKVQLRKELIALLGVWDLPGGARPLIEFIEGEVWVLSTVPQLCQRDRIVSCERPVTRQAVGRHDVKDAAAQPAACNTQWSPASQECCEEPYACKRCECWFFWARLFFSRQWWRSASAPSGHVAVACDGSGSRSTSRTASLKRLGQVQMIVCAPAPLLAVLCLFILDRKEAGEDRGPGKAEGKSNNVRAFFPKLVCYW